MVLTARKGMTPDALLQVAYVFPLTADLKPVIKWRKGSCKGVASFPKHKGAFGIDCGKSGLVVLDVDVKNGKDGRESLKSLPPLPDTFTVKTKSGGLHYYFSGEGRNTAGTIGIGLDTRGSGGFVVAYSEVLDPSPIAPLPEWLAEALRPAPCSEAGTDTLIDLDQPRNIAKAVELAHEATPAVEGDSGDARTLQLAMRLKDLGISQDMALEILLSEWNDRCEPPWDAGELGRKVANAYEYGKSAPGSATEEHRLAESARRVDEAFADIEKSPAPAKGLQIIPASRWGMTEPPPVDPILEGLFDRGDVACIIGSAKSYKTWFVLQLAICAASGFPFLGVNVPKARKALFIQFEVKAEHFHRRFKILLRGLGLKDAPDNLAFVNCRGLDVGLKEIAKAVTQWGAEIIFLDPLYMLIEGEENNSTDMKTLLKGFAAIARDAGAAIVFTHHDAKGTAGDRKTSDRGSGSGVLGRFYDAALTISDHRENDAYRVITPLLRNYKPVEPFCVTWNQCFSVADAPAEVLTSRSNNQNPNSRKPPEMFIPDVRRCIALADTCAINKGALIQALRESAGLTKAHAEKAIDAALDAFEEEQKIFTNGGKGVHPRQHLYALSEDDLQSRINELCEETKQ